MHSLRLAAGLLALSLLAMSSVRAQDVPAPPPTEGPPPSPELPGILPAPTPLPMPADAAAEKDNPEPPACGLRQIKVDYTFLPALSQNNLQINDLELSTTLALPIAKEWAPLLITPGLAAHVWDGPDPAQVPGTPELPRRLYDTSLDLGWRPRLAKWLFADLGITPGLYTDFRDVNARAFQLRGRGLAIVAFSPQFQLVLGALYVNRNRTKLLPAGGFIWNPDEDTKLQVVFPQPMLARRLATFGDAQWWGYLSGEFGGGRWVVEQADGSIVSVDYTDIRAILGLECLRTTGVKGHVEIGYAFARRVDFTSATPDYEPDSTLMLRVGLSY
jgi:hypothetical protein